MPQSNEEQLIINWHLRQNVLDEALCQKCVSRQIDFLGALRLRVTADKLCDTSACLGGLQTLASVSILLLHSSLCNTFSSVSDSSIQAEKKRCKTTLLIEPERRQKKMDSKKRPEQLGRRGFLLPRLDDLLSLPRSSSLLLTPLPAVF